MTLMRSIKNILVICCICVLGGCATNNRLHRDACVVGTIAGGTAIASAKAGALTGQAIAVDGGMTPSVIY